MNKTEVWGIPEAKAELERRLAAYRELRLAAQRIRDKKDEALIDVIEARHWYAEAVAANELKASAGSLPAVVN